MYGRHFLNTMLASASIAAVAVSSAFAADLNGAPPYSSIKDEPIYAPAFSWTGVYVGAQGGYMWGKADHSYSSDWGPSGSSDSNGWIGGVHTGYNMQSGNVVYGIEADVEGGNASGSFTSEIDGHDPSLHQAAALDRERPQSGRIPRKSPDSVRSQSDRRTEA